MNLSVDSHFSIFEQFNITVGNFSFVKHFTDVRKVTRIIKKTLKKPSAGKKKLHYMTYVPNVFYFMDTELYDLMKKMLFSKENSIKIVCYNEEHWATLTKEVVFHYFKASPGSKEESQKKWHRYLDDTYDFAKGLIGVHGERVIRVLPDRLPYHYVRTDKEAFWGLPDTKAFQNKTIETAHHLNLLAFEIKEKDKRKISILDNWFDEHYNTAAPLNLKALHQHLQDLKQCQV